MNTPRILTCLSTHDRWYAESIRSLTESPVNHTFMMYESELWGGWWATQTDEHGVRKLPAEKVIAGQTLVEYWEYQYDLGPGLKKVRRYVGAKYDWLGLGWGVFRLWAQTRLGISIARPMHSISRVTCFEFMAEILKAAKVGGTEKWETSSISPKDFRQFLIMHPGFKQVDCPI